MRENGKAFLLALAAVWLVWGLVAIFAQKSEAKPAMETSAPVAKEPIMISVQVKGAEAAIALEDYLIGVLVSEMPPDFHEEAKMAQAVAARTFTLKMMKAGNRHGACAVCDDPLCCQGYLSLEDYLAVGGTQQAWEGAAEAVKATENMVLTYEGSLIEATYFSCSGGRTEDALAVWGTDIPYLQAVDSPGEEGAAFYTDSVRYEKAELESRLGILLGEESANWFSGVTRTAGGGVASITIGGKEFQGNSLRWLLDLRSTRFSVTPVGSTAIFTTWGFGHRVGMSQYGAEAMAAEGNTWEEILRHYYRGAVAVKWKEGE